MEEMQTFNPVSAKQFLGDFCICHAIFKSCTVKKLGENMYFFKLQHSKNITNKTEVELS